jgi:hypothetical protein
VGTRTLRYSAPVRRAVRPGDDAAHRDDDIGPFGIAALKLARNAVGEVDPKLAHRLGDRRMNTRERLCPGRAGLVRPWAARAKSASDIWG